MEEKPKTVTDETELLSILSGAPALGSEWLHVKTHKKYVVTAVGLREEDLSPTVAYRRVDSGLVWFRPVAQFLDGRFQKIS